MYFWILYHKIERILLPAQLRNTYVPIRTKREQSHNIVIRIQYTIKMFLRAAFLCSFFFFKFHVLKCCSFHQNHVFMQILKCKYMEKRYLLPLTLIIIIIIPSLCVFFLRYYLFGKLNAGINSEIIHRENHLKWVIIILQHS